MAPLVSLRGDFGKRRKGTGNEFQSAGGRIMMAALALCPENIGKARRRYEFTPVMDDLVRAAYQRLRVCSDRKAISNCGRRLGVPRWVVLRRGRELGLARTKEKPWSDMEIRLLERWGHLTDAVIQRKLKAAGYSRSVNGIHLKLKRLRIKQNLDGYSAYSLAEAFGVDSHKVGLWIRRNMLRATRRGTDRKESQGGDSYWITHIAVRDFVFRFPEEIELAKVEKLWFLDLVSGGRIGVR
jgi:hypothetical protein